MYIYISDMDHIYRYGYANSQYRNSDRCDGEGNAFPESLEKF